MEQVEASIGENHPAAGAAERCALDLQLIERENVGHVAILDERQRKKQVSDYRVAWKKQIIRNRPSKATLKKIKKMARDSSSCFSCCLLIPDIQASISALIKIWISVRVSRTAWYLPQSAISVPGCARMWGAEK
jgi:hypothetical protein